MSPRVIWKGAVSFGLVHVPVALYPASQDAGIDFDWLDRRSMDPVGYQRINKRTGKPIKGDDVVKGIQQDDGEYVLISDDQIKAALPTSTQTIEIEAFVTAAEIPFLLLEKPYYLEPIGKGEKVYALLREAMFEAGVIGISRVVMHTKEHLAALIPMGSALVLNTIRWASEIRPMDELKLPPGGKTAAGVKAAELKLATQLISDMITPWNAEQYENRFVSAVQALVDKKLAAGDTQSVTPVEDAPRNDAPSNVVDLTQLLARSLAQRKEKPDPPGAAAAPKGRAAPKTPPKRRA
ncbi:DNA-binding protein [Hydrogenophaga sp. Root209]|uniref:non-homologous end joining protein Ku n=1 Tax=unclassified Hydrogenophaga TaxID=2610897 RepID=UPI0006FE4326|nr:Ku protein [Hydrogenophaga sp. Root209]KRC00457.1 DNA-binding protein [Hydrogenophaga sp. Root209]